MNRLTTSCGGLINPLSPDNWPEELGKIVKKLAQYENAEAGIDGLTPQPYHHTPPEEVKRNAN